MQTVTNLSAIASRYDAFLLDIWGVVHDGSQLYPGVHGCIERMHEAGKKIIFLSNAPRRAHKVTAVLEKFGIEKNLYDAVVSSGEVGYKWLAGGHVPWGKHFYYIGPEGTREWTDADILSDLDYVRVSDIKEADFLLNVGFGSEAQSSDDWAPLLRAAKARGIPMLCLNPDLEVVKITGQRFACAGVLAQDYQRMGGQVTWFGKPYPAVYDYCMERFDSVAKSRILAVGDSLTTDIPGAHRQGIATLLVTGGILHHHSPAELEAMCRKENIVPDYVMPQLAW